MPVSDLASGFKNSYVPEVDEVFKQRRLSNIDAMAPENQRRKTVANAGLTGASALTLKQSILPVTLVTTLFFMWGFAYGLLDTLNGKFQVSLNVTKAKAGGLQAAYFGAYFIGPLTWSGWLVRRFGFRYTFMAGLIIYGIGALMFWPSAVYRSFGGFCGSLFIVGSGLSTLETSANPYIAICGPPSYSEFRLELSQSFQAIGSVIAPLVAAKAFYGVDASDLKNVQWTYLAIAIFVFLLAGVFFVAPIPEVTDADMALQAEQVAAETGAFQEKPLYKHTKLFFGVAAQFCYVGAQVAVASQFINYVTETTGLTQSAASNRYAIAQAVFTVGRFAAAGLMLLMKPRYILMIFMTGVMIFIICSIAVKGEAGVALLTIVLFFESCVFPTILTLSIRGLGRHTKRGASWIVAAVSGGALFPAITGLVSDKYNANIGMVVPMAAFIVSFAFPIYLNVFCRAELDGFRETRIGHLDEAGTIGDINHDRRKNSVTMIEKPITVKTL